MTERIKRLMNPGTPKKDEDISQVLDSWIKERRAISDHGVEELPTEFQITALKIIMTNHHERFGTIERASRASVDAAQNIIDNIKDYATELRLRKMRPMNSGGFVDQVASQERTEGEQEDWIEETWKGEGDE